MPRYRRPSDPRTRSRDSFEGMKVLVIIMAVWSFGFLWLSTAGYVPWISGNYTNTACCNVLDFCVLALLAALLLRFRKEEKMKRRISERLAAEDVITAKSVADEFAMNNESVAKVMYDWARENPGAGTHDVEARCIRKLEKE